MNIVDSSGWLMQQARVVDVTAAVSLLAAAKSMDAILWTQDSDFIGIPDVRYIKK